MRGASIVGAVVALVLTAGACAAQGDRVIESQVGQIRVQVVADRLEHGEAGPELIDISFNAA